MAAVARHREQGYTAIRAQSGIPGLAGVYGIAKGGAYEPAVRGARPRRASGPPSATSTSHRSSSRACARSSARTSTSSTTCTTA